MTRRLVTVGTIASLLACAVPVALWVRSYSVADVVLRESYNA